MFTAVGMMYRLQTSLVPLAALSLLFALVFSFLAPPVEATMGIVQKIFYFHVPSAYSMYLAWAVCAVASVAYLVRGNETWDMLAKSAAELSLLFAAMVMVTGPLWGRKAWGAYWTWDPRLTASLLFTLIAASYVLLRALSSGEAERRFAAALSILGACVMPFIHVSVTKWRGQHPSVLQDGGLDPEMLSALVVCFFAFTLLLASLLFVRFRLEHSRRRLERLSERSLAKGRVCKEE